MIKVGSDFSGVGAFDQALKRLNIDYKTIFACDMDKYARQTYIANYGEPSYYPNNVYNRKIPTNPLDLYMTSPPCQSFSLAGKRKGEDSINGILFFNSYEFIKNNKPRYFIFENVKGLLSDNNGKTFAKWCNYLGGKSINGNALMLPHNESLPYHIYTKVLNAKHYGVPQNRERIFIIGIRDDTDNTFIWPKPIPLVKSLKDVLENDIDEKYYLSDKMLELISYNRKSKGIIADLNKGGQKGAVFSDTSDYISCLTASDYKQPKQIQIKSAKKKGFEAGCNKGILIGAIRGRNPDNPKSRIVGLPTEQMLELNKNGTSNTLTTVQKDNVVVYGKISQDYKIRRLTPRECFRLMDFPDSFKMPCSNSQMYKQAGNSIVVNVLAKIIEKLLK